MFFLIHNHVKNYKIDLKQCWKKQTKKKNNNSKDSLHKSPADAGRKLNVHKTFRRRSGRLLNVLYTFNLRPVSAGSCVTFSQISLENTCVGVFFNKITGLSDLKKCVRNVIEIIDHRLIRTQRIIQNLVKHLRRCFWRK